MLALEEKLQHASHEVVRASSTIEAQEQQLQLLEQTTLTLKPHIENFSSRLRTVEMALRNLLGDTILAAGLVVYTGVLLQDDRARLLKTWQSILAEVGIDHSADFTLCRFMEATARQFSLLPRSVILDEGMKTSLYLAALVRLLKYN